LIGGPAHTENRAVPLPHPHRTDDLAMATARHLLVIAACLVAALAAACTRAPNSPADVSTAAANTIDAADAPPSEPSTDRERELAGAQPDIGAEPSLEHFFSGKALAVIEQRSQPAPPAVIQHVETHVGNVGALEGCSRQSAPYAARLIDLDNDDSPEAISFYDLSGCRDSAVVRVLGVFRQDDTGGWHSVMDTALSVVPGEERPVLALGEGSITISGGPDGFGGFSDAEVIAVPFAGRAPREDLSPESLPAP
jgi:hypothetical protein